MSAPVETILSRALRAHRAALLRMEPSTELDVRFERSLLAFRIERTQAVKRRRLSWALAAAATVVLIASTSWLTMHADARRGEAVVQSSGYMRIASPDAAVVRVRASLGAPLPVSAANAFPAHRRQYWVDVGIAVDGSLYVEGVIPADEDPELSAP